MPRPNSQLKRKLAVLDHAASGPSVSRTCRFFGISRDTFYEWHEGLGQGRSGGQYPEVVEDCPHRTALDGSEVRQRRSSLRRDAEHRLHVTLLSDKPNAGPRSRQRDVRELFAGSHRGVDDDDGPERL